MNIKKPLVAKKNVVNMLALILTGDDTNKKISDRLKRVEATISEHLAPLSKTRIIYTRENKKNNEKNYEVNCEKIAEIFFMRFLEDKKLLKYKKNDFVTLTFAGIISAKKGLIEKNPKQFDRIALVNIFSEAMKYFYYRGKELERGNESLALKGYKTEFKTTQEEFKNFLKAIYQNLRKKIEEEKKKEEETKTEEGKSLVENIPLDVKKDYKD